MVVSAGVVVVLADIIVVSGGVVFDVVNIGVVAVSYTHLTLPTILRV